MHIPSCAPPCLSSSCAGTAGAPAGLQGRLSSQDPLLCQLSAPQEPEYLLQADENLSIVRPSVHPSRAMLQNLPSTLLSHIGTFKPLEMLAMSQHLFRQDNGSLFGTGIVYLLSFGCVWTYAAPAGAENAQWSLQSVDRRGQGEGERRQKLLPVAASASTQSHLAHTCL